MKNLKVLLVSMVSVAMFSCNSDKKPVSKNATAKTTQVAPGQKKEAAAYDPQRGLGKWTAENVDVHGFNPEMAAAGEKIAETKCFSCHKPTTERLVGPGWAGVTKRHTYQWIMNFITNPDAMINVDPSLQEQLEICQVRMPNQGLTDQQAREVLEYMRQIDGDK